MDVGCGRRVGPFDCCSIVLGNSNELLVRIPDISFDAVITDPPYGVNAEDWDGEVPYALLNEFLRIAPGPVLWFGSAARMCEDLHQFPVPPQRILIWAPKFTLSHTKANGIYFRFHPIHCWNFPRTDNALDVLTDSTERGNWWKHSCTKPLSLMRKLCRIAPAGGTILDPFAGSGTTCVAAKENGQHFLGFEIDALHVATANERLGRVQPSLLEERYTGARG